MTIVAIGAYIGHMWARNRAIARLTATPHRSGQVQGPYGGPKPAQNAVVTSDGPASVPPPTETAPPPPPPPPDDRP